MTGCLIHSKKSLDQNLRFGASAMGSTPIFARVVDLHAFWSGSNPYHFTFFKMTVKAYVAITREK
jgi:hypothetical protein